MARTTTMTLKESTGIQQEFVEEVYEHKWTIPNWFTIINKRNCNVADLKFEIFTGKPNRLQTKWVIGIIKNPYTDSINPYWKMVEMENFKGEIEVRIFTSHMNNSSSKHWTESQFAKPKLNELIKVYRSLPVKTSELLCDQDKEDLTINLQLVIKVPKNILVTQLHEISVTQAATDFLGILQDKSTADLKIITSDEIELFAHKCILKARCQFFESMFRREYSENNTGIVNVKDISGKTMGILLHYFYSGRLLSSWRDSDIIVEFLYAAGKYQMSGVLEIVDLDMQVEYGDDEENSELEQQLLDITNKLCLQNAEARLLKRVDNRKRKAESDVQI